jgi:L-asparaginase
MGIALVATGGTIASLPDPQSGALRPAVSAGDLISSVPQLADAGITRVEEVEAVNGWNMTPAAMLRVARTAQLMLSQEEIDGVVVTHGTDTVEETAFLCDLLVDSQKPVVFAAAMRSGDQVSSDGPRNLLHATQVAGSPQARGCGAVLSMNDEVHAARWVRKIDSFRVSAFQSPGHGPIGVLAPDGLRLKTPPRRVKVRAPDSLDVHPVPVIQAYVGLEESLIEAVIETVGAAGIVLEGTGLGNLPGTATRGIAVARERGIPVVVATRVPSGGTGPVYGGPGGGVTLREMGVLAARGLSTAKARLLLMAVLATHASSKEAAERFAALAEQLL